MRHKRVRFIPLHEASNIAPAQACYASLGKKEKTRKLSYSAVYLIQALLGRDWKLEAVVYILNLNVSQSLLATGLLLAQLGPDTSPVVIHKLLKSLASARVVDWSEVGLICLLPRFALHVLL